MSVQTSAAAQEVLARLDERKRSRQDGDLRAQMAKPEGRRLMFRLLDGYCGVLSPTFGGEQPLGNAYREGRRSVGLELVQEIQRVCGEEWDLMWREQRELQRQDQRSREQIAAEVEAEESR